MQQELKKTTTASRRDFLKVFWVYSCLSCHSIKLSTACAQSYSAAYSTRRNRTRESQLLCLNIFFDGIDYCPIVVKVRDGRPIKIEGNKLSSLTQGGTNARTQASVLGLYDNARYKEPQAKASAASWEEVDEAIVNQLDAIKAKGWKSCVAYRKG